MNGQTNLTGQQFVTTMVSVVSPCTSALQLLWVKLINSLSILNVYNYSGDINCSGYINYTGYIKYSMYINCSGISITTYWEESRLICP